MEENRVSSIMGKSMLQFHDASFLLNMKEVENNCDSCEKYFFCDLIFSTKKNILHMVKNILWFFLYMFNIDWVRSCQRVKL